ncbi:hypothetical protein SCP_1301290 [Sparassis crispa]|uniref:Uncharacterized protein n=1 Tax=Sparassis crispa TaxID=139825 RepID=A0A401H1L7_9APHY|nr:hypothetical protein SCP_1301290 [Sparassis crispa]GBE88314.1 hypothetical protein SCP_1301290 [Sparassis crispa]
MSITQPTPISHTGQLGPISTTHPTASSLTVTDVAQTSDITSTAECTNTRGPKRALIDIELTDSGCKKASKKNPLVYEGHHFGRTVEMFTLITIIINEGVACEQAAGAELIYSEEQAYIFILL